MTNGIRQILHRLRRLALDDDALVSGDAAQHLLRRGGMTTDTKTEPTTSRTRPPNGLLLRTAMIFLCLAGAAAAQPGWKTETTRDGKVRVQSRVTFAKATDGSETPIVEYMASTTAQASFARCLSVLRDVSNHKLIHDDHSSETVAVLSENERIVHYGLKVVWPLPKIDCVARMVVSVDSIARTATIALTGAPDQLAPRAERRLAQYQQTYVLKDLGDGLVELRSVGKSAPPFAVPRWMLKAAFPSAAADPLLMIVELSRRTGPPARP